VGTDSRERFIGDSRRKISGDARSRKGFVGDAGRQIGGGSRRKVGGDSPSRRNVGPNAGMRRMDGVDGGVGVGIILHYLTLNGDNGGGGKKE